MCDIVAQLKERIAYEYDFGDSWIHAIKLVKSHPVDAFRHTPCCLDGANAAPPDDCGGIPGYYHLLEVIANKKHPEHRDLLDWLDGPFDPAAFDCDAINRRLRAI